MPPPFDWTPRIRHESSFALIALIVTLISYLVLMINGLGVGLNEQAGSALRSFDADAVAYSDRAGLSVIRSEMSTELVNTAAAESGARESAALGYMAANYRASDGSIDSAAFLGFDPGTIGEPDVTGGRALTPEDGNGILADKGFLRYSGLNVGDTVTISVRLQEQDYVILGEIDEGSFFFQPAVYLLRTSWQQLKYGGGEEFPAASIVLLKGNGLAGKSGNGWQAVSKSTAFANIEGVSGQQSTVQALRVFGYLIGGLVIASFSMCSRCRRIAKSGAKGRRRQFFLSSSGRYCSRCSRSASSESVSRSPWRGRPTGLCSRCPTPCLSPSRPGHS